MTSKLFLFVGLFLSIPFISFAQAVPPGTKWIKKIYATQYEKGDTLLHKVNISYEDSLGNSIEYHSESGKYISTYPTPLSEVQTYVKANGEISTILVYIFDDKRNRTYNFQLSPKGDTLVGQKRIYDAQGNVLMLFNRDKTKGTYSVKMRSEYDKNNEVTYREVFNASGSLVYKEEFKTSPDGKIREHYKSDDNGKMVIRTRKTLVEPGISKVLYFYEQEGYNYGIAFKYMPDGYSITKTDSKGRSISEELYDKKNKLLASVYTVYTEVK